MIEDKKMDSIGRVIRGSLFKGHDDGKEIYISRQPYRPGAQLPIVSSMERDVMIKGVGSMYTYLVMADCEAEENPPKTHLMVHMNTDNISRYIIEMRKYPLDFSKINNEFERGFGVLDSD